MDKYICNKHAYSSHIYIHTYMSVDTNIQILIYIPINIVIYVCTYIQEILFTHECRILPPTDTDTLTHCMSLSHSFLKPKYLYTLVEMHVCTYLCMYVRLSVYIVVYTHSCLHACMHTWRTYIHTYMCKGVRSQSSTSTSYYF